MSMQRFRCAAIFAAVLAAVAADCGDALSAESTSEPPPAAIHLDRQHPTFAQRVDATCADPTQAKFVEVQIAKIANPQRYGLTFEVTYEHDGAQLLLGTFSPFPADNPGTFIVATQGRVGPRGTIRLAMILTDQPQAGVPVEVTIARMKLIEADPRAGDTQS